VTVGSNRFDTNGSTPFSTIRSASDRKLGGAPFYGLPAVDRTDIPVTTIGGRMALTFRHAVTAFRNPKRADSVAMIGELTSLVALEQLRHAMKQNPIGTMILNERPIVSTSTIPFQQVIDSASTISFVDIPYWTLLNIYYEQEYHTPLSTLRQRYNILPAPYTID
jgi:ubiquinone biosynthesis protein Coq4